MDVAETCFINQSSASPKLKPSKDDPDKVAVKPSSESVRHDTFGLTPTIAVLPPSPRHAVSPIESCEISAKASTHESIDSSSVIEGQRLSRPRHLSWSTDVADSCESTLSEMSSVTPTESSYEKLTFTSSAPVSEDRIDKRTLTLPLPRIKRSLSPDLDSRTNRSASTSPTDFSSGIVFSLLKSSTYLLCISGAGVETNLWKRQTRRRSQTGPPLFASLHSQLGKMGVRPVTLASEEPAVIVSVEQRHHSAQSGSSSSVPKLRQKWVSVLKEMFKELAEQSDNKGRTLDKETFLKYFPLPGVLGERLFDLFDADGSQTIDFQEFFMGLALIYNGTAEERKRFLFNM